VMTQGLAKGEDLANEKGNEKGARLEWR